MLSVGSTIARQPPPSESSYFSFHWHNWQIVRIWRTRVTFRPVCRTEGWARLEQQFGAVCRIRNVAFNLAIPEQRVACFCGLTPSAQKQLLNLARIKWFLPEGVTDRATTPPVVREPAPRPSNPRLIAEVEGLAVYLQESSYYLNLDEQSIPLCRHQAATLLWQIRERKGVSADELACGSCMKCDRW